MQLAQNVVEGFDVSPLSKECKIETYPKESECMLYLSGIEFSAGKTPKVTFNIKPMEGPASGGTQVNPLFPVMLLAVLSLQS